MSNWIEQFENHPIYDNIRSGLVPLASLKASRDDFPAEEIEKIDRIEYVLFDLQRRLKQIDPLLTPLQTLNNANNTCSQIGAQLAAYQSNSNPVHLQRAYNFLENLLIHVAQIPIAQTVDDMEAIREAAISLRRSAGQHIRHIESQGESVSESLSEIEVQAENLRKKIEQQDNTVANLIDNFSNEFTSTQNARDTKYESLIEQYKSAFDSQMESNRSAWDTVVSERDAKYQELMEDLQKKLDDLQASYDSQASAIIENIEKRKAEAEKIVGIITDTGMIGGYQNAANAEKQSALTWRRITFGSLTLLVLSAIALFVVTLSGKYEVTTNLTITRGFVGVAITLLAGYAAKQSEKHERVQRRHRKMELELASLAPFLYEFPDAQALEIKKELAMKMFAQEIKEHTKSSRRTTNSALNLAEMAIDAMKNLIVK